MCSRYELRAPQEEPAVRFGLAHPPEALAGPEVRPGNRALVVGPDRRPRLPRWGLAGRGDGRPLINARAETLAEKPTFRPLLQNRVLVPATAWFEWRTAGRRDKRRYTIRPAAGHLFAFAGLMDRDRFTIITCPPAPSVATIHDRMPVLLPVAAEAAWLDTGRPFAEVATLLTPSAEALETEGDAPDQGDLFA